MMKHINTLHYIIKHIHVVRRKTNTTAEQGLFKLNEPRDNDSVALHYTYKNEVVYT